MVTININNQFVYLGSMVPTDDSTKLVVADALTEIDPLALPCLKSGNAGTSTTSS